MEPSLEISAELTPNPNTLKFVVQKELLPSGSRSFPTLESASGSPLPLKLFEIPDVASVMVGTDFVSVTKRPEADWTQIARTVVEKIHDFLRSGQPAVSAQAAPVAAAGDDISRQIQEILDEEIRPAVARDGGDILFRGYEDGVVKLHLQGACSSCPSSLVTLKMGIENRLKQSFPEIREVIQVA